MARRIVVWSATARGELRAIDRGTALNVLLAIDRYLETGAGDAIKLQPPRTEFRLRVGDYRVLFRRIDEQTIEVLRVRHRSGSHPRQDFLRRRNSPIPSRMNPAATSRRSPTPRPGAPAKKARAASAMNARPMQMYHQGNRRTL